MVICIYICCTDKESIFDLYENNLTLLYLLFKTASHITWSNDDLIFIKDTSLNINDLTSW